MSEETSSNGPVEGAAGPAGGSMAPEVSRRVSSILNAVEQEAARLREEAREQAQAYLEEARRRADELVAERRGRIAELSDELITKSEAVVDRLEEAAPVRESFENLVRALGQAADALSEEADRARGDFEPPEFRDGGADAAASEPAAPKAQFSGSGAAAAPGAGSASSEQTDPSLGPAAHQPDGVRTIAIQMAGAGWTRRDVGRHLNQSLGITDTEPILEEIFGAGSPDDARVPWTAYSR